jgi:plastocyanin
VHLPGPSAWPFLAPVGLLFIVAGFVFGPVMIVGGLILAAIAIVGWLRDAEQELVDIEAHGHTTPETRDPERAWPKALVPVYVGVAGVVLVFTLLPWAFSLLPATGADEEIGGPPPVSTPFVSASSATAFEINRISTFADEPFQLEFENKQLAVPHNVAIYDTSAQEVEFFRGEIFEGPDARVYDVGALSQGTYFFVCSVHPPMTGTLFVK